MPGVTVEAASPALIQKMRAAITDGSGGVDLSNLFNTTHATGFDSGFDYGESDGGDWLLPTAIVAPRCATLVLRRWEWGEIMAERVLDVRAQIRAGQEPFADIMRAAAECAADEDHIRHCPKGESGRDVCAPMGGKQDIGVEENAVDCQRDFGGGNEPESCANTFYLFRHLLATKRISCQSCVDRKLIFEKFWQLRCTVHRVIPHENRRIDLSVVVRL